MGSKLAKRRAVVRRTMWPCASSTKVLHRGRSKAVHWLVVDVGLRLILWRQAIRAYFERASLPCEPVEAVDCARSVLAAAHEHVAVSTTAIVGTEADIGAQHGSGLAEEVLEVLPSHTVRELR